MTNDDDMVEVYELLDKFMEKCNLVSEKHPYIVIILMHEFFRNIWPNDSFIEEKLSVKQFIFASSSAVYGEGSYSCDLHGISYPISRKNDELKTKHWEYYCENCGEIHNNCGGKVVKISADEGVEMEMICMHWIRGIWPVARKIKETM